MNIKKKKMNINKNFLFNIDFSKLVYQKIGFLLLGCVKSKDTTKPMNDRGKDLLFSASKGEDMRDPSRSSVLGAGNLGKFSVKGTSMFMKGLEQRRVQHRTGVKDYGIQALVVEVWKFNIIAPSSTWVGALVPEDCIRLLCIFLEEELGLGSMTKLLFFDCFSFVPSFFCFL